MHLLALPQAMAVEMPFTVILDDPLSNSYIQNTWAPDVDPNLTEEDYERTFDQNEELGLNDIQTENYGHVEVPEEGQGKDGEAEKEKVVVQA